jgi:solute carrier family 25, member 44
MSSSIQVEWQDLHLPTMVGSIAVLNVLENLVVYPLYHVKTRQQVERANVYRGSMSLMREIIRNEGVTRGLYRGFWQSTITSSPSYAMYLIAYHWSKHWLSSSIESVDPDKYASVRSLATSAIPMLSGIVAEVAGSILYSPCEIITQRLLLPPTLEQPNSSATSAAEHGGVGSRKPPYQRVGGFRAAADAVQSIWNREGIRGFYRGFGVSLFGTALLSGLWWQIYEPAKPAYRNLFSSLQPTRSLDQSLQYQVQAAAGCTAGVVTAIVLNPLDVVKTRLQTQHSMVALMVNAGNAAEAPEMYRNAWHGFRAIVRTEGFKGFTRGLVAKCIRNGPTSAFSSLMYELVIKCSTSSIVGSASS